VTWQAVTVTVNGKVLHTVLYAAVLRHCLTFAVIDAPTSANEVLSKLIVVPLSVR
jgi:hypothetical protein